jgi:hypothetical protein
VPFDSWDLFGGAGQLSGPLVRASFSSAHFGWLSMLFHNE